MLPWSAKVTPEVQTRYTYGAFLEGLIKVVGKRVRSLFCDLVLHRDMGPPLLHILPAKPWSKQMFQAGVNLLQLGTGYREGDASLEVAQTVDLGPDRRMF